MLSQSNVASGARRKRVRAPLVMPNLDVLPPTAALTDRQVAALSNHALITLKIWRAATPPRGPKVTRIEGAPRYLVRDVREWMGIA